jgi:hypothetical protein
VPTIGKPEDVLLGTPNQKDNRQITATFAAQATCVKDGKRYAVSASVSDGIDGRIEVSAFGKDIQACIDGLKGKAEARILKKLFFLACDATELDDDEATVIVVEPSPAERIEQAPVAQEPPMPSTQRAHEASLDRLRKILAEAPDKLAFVENVWKAITDATTEEHLVEAGNALAAMKQEYSSQVLSLIRPFYQARQTELKEPANG